MMASSDKAGCSHKVSISLDDPVIPEGSSAFANSNASEWDVLPSPPAQTATSRTDPVVTSIQTALAMHRQTMQRYFKEWILEQDRLVDRALTELKAVQGACDVQENLQLANAREAQCSDTTRLAPSPAQSQAKHARFDGEDGKDCATFVTVVESPSSTQIPAGDQSRYQDSSGLEPDVHATPKYDHKASGVVDHDAWETTLNLTHVPYHIESTESQMEDAKQPTEGCSRAWGINSSALEGLGLRRASNSSQSIHFFRRLRHKHTVWRKTAEGRMPDGCTSRVVASKCFEGTCSLVIMANSIFIAYSADHAMNTLDQPPDETIQLIELFFCLFYTLELMLRLEAHRGLFFFGSYSKWNMLDVILVLFAIYDQVEYYTTRAMSIYGRGANLSALRLMRLMKMVKLLRMIRFMRMFRELRLILNSIMGSVKSMLWSVLLVTCVTFMFGIAFLQAGTSYLKEPDIEVRDPRTCKAIKEYWGSVGGAMLTLYTVSTGGQDWKPVAKPLEQVGTTFYILFLLYIAFYMFVVTNTLTSLFVESAIQMSERDQQAAIHEELSRKSEYISKIRALFEKLDTTGAGRIGYDEFCRQLSHPEMLAFAANLEIDAMDVEEFFRVLSSGGKFLVDIDTFVIGCIKLKGFAKSMDLLDLIHLSRKRADDEDEFQAFCKKELTEVKMLLSRARPPARKSLTQSI